MAEPKDKSPKKRAPKREGVEHFDPYWNNCTGKVDSKDEYIQTAAREPKGFHRGARIR